MIQLSAVRILSFVGIGLFVLLPQFVFSQNYHIIRVGGKETGRKQVEDILSSERSGADLLLRLRIADVDRACNLDYADLRKLKVAAKGAVERVMQNRRAELEKNLKRYQAQAGIVENEAMPLDEEKAKELIEAIKNKIINKRARNLAPKRVVSYVVYPLQIPAVEKEKIWTSSFKKVLNDEQRTAYLRWEEKRFAFQRKVAVMEFVAKADRKLFLTPDQKEKLLEVIDKELGEKLQKSLAKRDLNANQQRGVINVFGNSTRKSRYHDLVADILSETQLEEWKRSLDLELQGL